MIRKTFNLHPIIVLAIVLLSILITACGKSAEVLNREGNKAFAEQAYLDALAAYESAQVADPALAEPYYNAANSLYRQGAYEEALSMIGKALAYADMGTLEQYGFFNGGNASYNLEDFESAVEAYRQSLLLDPGDQAAKYNLELALQQLQQKQQEQEQQQEDQEKEQSQDGEGQQDTQQEEGSADGQDQQESQQQGDETSQNDEEQQSGIQQGEQSENQEMLPRPGERMSAEQARQLLAAIAQETQTLQERLGQIFVVPPNPPVQDW